MDIKDPNTKKQLKKIICKTFGRKVHCAVNNPQTTILVNIAELHDYAERVSKLLTNRRNKLDINYEWFSEEEKQFIKQNKELCLSIWNSSAEERDLKWKRMYKEHAEKENSSIVKENKKLENKALSAEKIIEKEKDKIIMKFMLAIYLKEIDQNDKKLEEVINNYNKQGYLKKALNHYQKTKQKDGLFEDE